VISGAHRHVKTAGIKSLLDPKVI